MSQTRHLTALKNVAAIVFSALIALTAVVPAHADERRGGNHDAHHSRDHHRDDRGRGGYPPPPVVYSPYYAPPPVVYGPSVGVYLPGISIGIH